VSTLASVNAVVERLWPLSGAEPWDSPGIVVGDPDQAVTHVRLAVDAVLEVVDEAVDIGADLLLVHHPLLFRGATTMAESTTKGAVVSRLVRAGCALVAAHTNADVVETGTSRVLAHQLGLVDQRPITAGSTSSTGLGITGRLPRPMSLVSFARQLGELLPPTAAGVRVAGDAERVVETVALCAGAGDSLLDHPDVRAADVYLTSDLRHHPASDARDLMLLGRGPALVDVSHWASEWLWLDTAAAQLREALDDVEVTLSDLRTDPWDFTVVQ
jgi:dinuclear metal center YbgI/SA1388 family protein